MAQHLIHACVCEGYAQLLPQACAAFLLQPAAGIRRQGITVHVLAAVDSPFASRLCSNYHENAAILLELPEGMKQLELLSLHAESVVSWQGMKCNAA